MLAPLRHFSAWFRQIRRRNAAPIEDVSITEFDSGQIVATPLPAVLLRPKRTWQRKFDDVLRDLRALEAAYAAYNIYEEELTRAHEEELTRAVEGFFKTCRELADWIDEATNRRDANKYVHNENRAANPSALKLCDAVAQTAKHYIRKPSRWDPIRSRRPSAWSTATRPAIAPTFRGGRRNRTSSW